MTKAEQARQMAWRFKVLQETAARSRNVALGRVVDHVRLLRSRRPSADGAPSSPAAALPSTDPSPEKSRLAAALWLAAALHHPPEIPTPGQS